MGLPDGLMQNVTDKVSDIWADLVAAGQPSVGFYDVVHRADDSQVDLYIGQGADVADDNLAAGAKLSFPFGNFFTGWVNYVATLSYTIDSWLTARKWRVHRYCRDMLSEQSQIVSRLNVYSEEVSLGTQIQGTGFTAGSDLSADVGPMRVHAKVTTKGAVDWVPVVTVKHEGPTTTTTAAMTDAVLTMTVANEAGFPVAGLPGQHLDVMIDSEVVHVTATDAGGAPAVWTILRAQKGTAAAAHSPAATVYFVSDQSPTVKATALANTYWPIKQVYVTTLSKSGQATVTATGIGGTVAFAEEGMYCLLVDRTCPQKLVATCAAAAYCDVEDASVFSAGDYCIIDDGDSAAELVTVRDVDNSLNRVFFDAATAGTFTLAQNAFLCLAFTTVNEGVGGLVAADATLTVTTAALLPPVAKCPYSIMIDDEILSVTNIAGADLTVTRGVQGTVDCWHATGTPVVLCPTDWNTDAPTYNRATEGGNQEWGIVLTAGANSIVLSENLKHTYGLAATVEPLVRDVILVADGAGGTAADAVSVVARPERMIARAD